MEKLDKIKTVFAVCMVGAVVISFVYLGKDHSVTRWLAACGIIVWLIFMFFTKRIKKQNETPND
jgi:uncharacterized membrane protein YfcA